MAKSKSSESVGDDGGARNRDVQKFSGNAFPFNEYSVDAFAKLTSWELTVIEGVREEECVALYREAAVERRAER